MELYTPVCDLLCCDVPIVAAGMGGVARSELVAAVTEAGGFAFLGMVREPPQLIRDEIAAVRARTDRPFGVNLIPAATPPDLLEMQVELCIAARVHAVTLFWDTPDALVERFRRAGVLVVRQVGSMAEARAARQAGADILIAQGWEAGGHVRGRTALAPLVADIAGQLDVPVLAAGGIVDGAGLASAMLLGAQGAVLGTAFIATEESFAHEYHKQRILEAEADVTIHTDMFHVNWPPGAHVRVLPNSVTRGARGDPLFSPQDVIGAEGERPIRLFSTDSPLRSMTGDFEAMALYAGQGVGRISAVVPAGDRVRSIAREASRLLRRRANHPAAAANPILPASPTCYAPEAAAGYMGFAEPDELAAELNLLLEATRASARVVARWAAEAQEPDLRRLLQDVQAEEARMGQVLFQALVDLKVEPSRKVGLFYENAMAVGPLAARLTFVRREQAWVRRRLRALTPRIRDDQLHAALRALLDDPTSSGAETIQMLARGERDEPAPPATS